VSPLPKIKIKLPSGDPNEFVCDLEQARQYLNFIDGVFLVERQRVNSYGELVRIAGLEKYKDKEFLEIESLQPIDGG
jgi:hypothetical protein